MKEIYMADWFYDKNNQGTHIKSPVELIVNISRFLGAEYGGNDALLFVQRILGQVLFMPPNVAGWPVGKKWIDSSSLVFRMDFGRKLIEITEFTQQLKADDDNDPNMMAANEKKASKKGKLYELRSTIKWDGLDKRYGVLGEEEMFNTLASHLINAAEIKYADAGFAFPQGDNITKLKSVITYLTSRPEFQLC
jgi:hypothetical protein